MVASVVKNQDREIPTLEVRWVKGGTVGRRVTRELA